MTRDCLAAGSETDAVDEEQQQARHAPQDAEGYRSGGVTEKPEKDRAPRVKSAYELALERLEGQGIARPREESLSPEQRAQVAELRRQAEAKLAELEILHRDRLRKLGDPEAREKEEEDYVRERRRIEERRDGKIGKARREV